MEMDEDVEISIILGCIFPTTIGAMIDVKSGKLSLQVREKNFEFNLT